MGRPWRTVIALGILAIAVSVTSASFLRGQLTQAYTCAQPPAGASSICQSCLFIFCASMGETKALSMCVNYCGPNTIVTQPPPPPPSAPPSSSVSSLSSVSASSASSWLTSSRSSVPQVSCGDGVCKAGTESRMSCPEDCDKPNICGNNTCDELAGETLTSCQWDCRTTNLCPWTNKICESRDFPSCPADCTSNLNAFQNFATQKGVGTCVFTGSEEAEGARCTETDCYENQGFQIYKKGTTQEQQSSSQTTVRDDFCMDGTVLVEYACGYSYKPVQCPNGCENGKCLLPTEPRAVLTVAAVAPELTLTGKDALFTFTVRNTGTAPAINVMLRHAFVNTSGRSVPPKPFVFVGATGLSCTAVDDGKTFLCSGIGDLQPYEERTVSIIFSATSTEPGICYYAMRNRVDVTADGAAATGQDKTVTAVQCRRSTMPSCGDGVCRAGSESRFTCPEDCDKPNICGNNYCDAAAGESRSTCYTDCIDVTGDRCKKNNNGICETGDFPSCAVDCAADATAFANLASERGVGTCPATAANGDSCTETDCAGGQGFQIYTKGSTQAQKTDSLGFTKTMIREDACYNSSSLLEYSCPGSLTGDTQRNGYYGIVVQCPYGCENGACRVAPASGSSASSSSPSSSPSSPRSVSSSVSSASSRTSIAVSSSSQVAWLTQAIKGPANLNNGFTVSPSSLWSYAYSAWYCCKSTAAWNGAEEGGTAQWSFTNLPYGVYDIFMSWPSATQEQKDMLFNHVDVKISMTNGEAQTQNVVVNQREDTPDEIWGQGTGPFYYKIASMSAAGATDTRNFNISMARGYDTTGKAGWMAAQNVMIKAYAYPPVCGNKHCETGEYMTCAPDCPYCGDGICSATIGETTQTCPTDCIYGTTGGSTGGTGGGSSAGGSTGGTGGSTGSQGSAGSTGSQNSAGSKPSAGSQGSQISKASVPNGSTGSQTSNTSATSSQFSSRASASAGASSRASSAGTCGNGTCAANELGGNLQYYCPADCPVPPANPVKDSVSGVQKYHTCPITDINDSTCSDTDCTSGKSIAIYKQGKAGFNIHWTNQNGSEGYTYTSYTDYCVSSTILREYFCQAQTTYGGLQLATASPYTDTICPYGCSNGACKSSPTTMVPVRWWDILGKLSASLIGIFQGR